MTTLADLVRSGDLEFSDGYRTKSSELAQDGFRIVRAGDVRDGRILLDGPDFVAPEFRAAVGEKVIRTGDVVLTTKGTVGRTAFVTEVTEFAVYSPQMCYFRFPSGLAIDASYFYYWLQSPEFKRQAGYLKESSDMAPYISLRDLGRMHISIHPFGVQQEFREVLGALDDKIAANVASIELFDGLAASLVARATDGATVRPLTEVATVVMGSSPTGESMNEVGVGVPFFQGTRDFGVRTPNRRVYTVGPVRMAKAGDVLLSVRAPVGSVNRAEADCCIGRGLASICAPRGENAILLHVLRQMSGVWEPYESDGTVFGSIGRKDLQRIEVLWPDSHELDRLVPVIDALENRLMVADRESRTLATLRDTLLPALMSGRLSVRDAEAAVSEVV